MKEKEIIDALKWRYATKKFNPDKKLSEEDLKTLLDSARLAPTSFGLQPFKIVVLSDPEIRKKISAVANNQPQVTDASHLLVFCALKNVDEEFVDKYMKNISKIRGTKIEDLENFRNTLLGLRKKYPGNLIGEWTKRQAYIALGFALETAAILGIDACPMEGFNPEGVDKVLGLDENLGSVAFCALGYRSDSDENASMKKVRFDERDLFEFR